MESCCEEEADGVLDCVNDEELDARTLTVRVGIGVTLQPMVSVPTAEGVKLAAELSVELLVRDEEKLMENVCDCDCVEGAVLLRVVGSVCEEVAVVDVVAVLVAVGLLDREEEATVLRVAVGTGELDRVVLFTDSVRMLLALKVRD